MHKYVHMYIHYTCIHAWYIHMLNIGNIIIKPSLVFPKLKFPQSQIKLSTCMYANGRLDNAGPCPSFLGKRKKHMEEVREVEGEGEGERRQGFETCPMKSL